MKIEESKISWSKIKLIENGAKGLEITYCFLYSKQGRTFMRKNNITDDLIPHDDLLILFRQLQPIVSKIENIDYARTLLTIPGFNPTDEQQKITEGLVRQNMDNIEVVSINLSTKKKADGCIISYRKTDRTDQVTGHNTAWINLSFEEYGVESDLLEIINQIKSETYQYHFEDKYADYEQIELYNEDDFEETEEIPEAKFIEENNQVIDPNILDTEVVESEEVSDNN